MSYDPQPNTGDTGRRLGPVDIPAPAPSVTPANAPAPTAPQTDAVAPDNTGAAVQPTKAEPAAAHVPVTLSPQAQATPGTDGMDPSFANKLSQLVAASHGAIRISSGFRSVDTQTQLWNQALQKYGSPEAARKWVAPPGHSNHNRGMAADLSGDLTLAHRLAPQFGLSFPMSWENWHIEPVGLRTQSPAAAYTMSPDGTQPNPTVDHSLHSTVPNMLATMSSAMGDGTMLNPAGTRSGSYLSSPTTAAVGTPATNPTFDNTGTAGGGTAEQTGNAIGSGSSGGAATAYNYSTALGPPQAPSQSQQDFINTVRPYAEAESKRTGIPASVFIVQSGVETGWGTSGWWRNNRNPAGIGVTGQAGAGNSYGDLASAFHDYADKLMGHGEAGQETFAAHVAQGASTEQLLRDLEMAPWAAGHYGGSGLTNTYGNLRGVLEPPAKPAPAAAAPAPRAPTPAPARDTRRAAR